MSYIKANRAPFLAIVICLSFLFSNTSHFRAAELFPNYDEEEQENIMGGEKVGIQDPAHRFVVYFKQTDTESGDECSASIISHDVALLAAHCIGGRMIIAFGDSMGWDGWQRSARAVDHWIVHPGYSPGREQNTNDLALVHFTGGLPPGYAPAHLAAGPGPARGTSLWVAGFGVSNIFFSGSGVLRKGQVTVSQGGSSLEIQSIPNHGQMDCFGDSGGPLYDIRGGQPEILGVVSRGDDSCRQNGVYTNVTRYRDWIIRAMHRL